MVCGNDIDNAVFQTAPERICVLGATNRWVHLSPGTESSVIISIQKQVIRNYFTTHLGRLVLTKVFDLDCRRQVKNMEASAIFLG